MSKLFLLVTLFLLLKMLFPESSVQAQSVKGFIIDLPLLPISTISPTSSPTSSPSDAPSPSPSPSPSTTPSVTPSVSTSPTPSQITPTTTVSPTPTEALTPTQNVLPTPTTEVAQTVIYPPTSQNNAPTSTPTPTAVVTPTPTPKPVAAPVLKTLPPQIIGLLPATLTKMYYKPQGLSVQTTRISLLIAFLFFLCGVLLVQPGPVQFFSLKVRRLLKSYSSPYSKYFSWGRSV